MVACQAQRNTEFLPPVEEFVRDDGEEADMFLDLDADRLWTPPAALHGAPQWKLLEWMRANGVDVVCETIASVRGLVGFEMVAIPADASLWTATGGDLVRDRLSWAQPGTPITMSAKGEAPATFIIKTREGGMGVLQITKLIDDRPRGAVVRYKLLASQKPAAMLEAATPAIAASTSSAVVAPASADTPQGVLAAAQARLQQASADYTEVRRMFEAGSLSFTGLLSASEAVSEARLRVAEANVEGVRAQGGDVAAARKALADARVDAVRRRVTLLSEECERCKTLLSTGKVTREDVDALEGQLKTAQALLEMMQE